MDGTRTRDFGEISTRATKKNQVRAQLKSSLHYSIPNTSTTMASLLKASNEIRKEAKGKGKGKADESTEVAPVKLRKDKVLMLCSRGVTQRHRHLMRDLEVLLPHTKKGEYGVSEVFSDSYPFDIFPLSGGDKRSSPDSKLDTKSSLHLINELADLHSCNNALYFETRRHEDLYLWLSRTPNGPSGKFHVQNIHTMDELKMTGNCLRGSRGICVFDGGWEEAEHWKLMKEMFSHVSFVHTEIFHHPLTNRSFPFRKPLDA